MYGINLANDQCEDCGYQGQIDSEECPQCGSKNIKRLKRVTRLFKYRLSKF